MSKPILCCDECFKLIACKNTNAAKLWLDLCEIQAKSPTAFELLCDDDNNLRVLELLQFITTTENPRGIIVKVNGLTKETFGSFFCGGYCFGECDE